MFLDLDQTRASSGFGSNPISFTEIANYCLLQGIEITPEEVDVIRTLDSQSMSYMAKKIKTNQANKKAK